MATEPATLALKAGWFRDGLSDILLLHVLVQEVLDTTCGMHVS
jgi:hypothetical protein